MARSAGGEALGPLIATWARLAPFALALAIVANSDRPGDGDGEGAGGGRFGPRPPVPPYGHVVSLRGIRVYYEDRGAGRVLVLLHGGVGNGGQFAGQVPYFAPHYRLVIPDACAQGRTTDRPGRLTYHAMGEDVAALLAHLHVKRCDVVGWSDGGIVGLDLAMRHPSLVSHLVTFGANFTADGMNPDDVAWNQTAKPADLGPAVREAYEKIAPDPAHYEVAMAKVIALWRDEPHYTTAELGTIRARCLIVAGEHDLVRPAHTAALAAAIPGSTLWIVPGANHGVMVDQPELVNPRIQAFLADAPPDSTTR
jgi:pimeloyl-ACP methyl ester carboxylesterase